MKNDSFYTLAKQGFDYIYKVPKNLSNMIHQGFNEFVIVDASKEIEYITDSILGRIQKELNK